MAIKNKNLNFDAFELMNEFNSFFESKVISNEELAELDQINKNIKELNHKLITEKKFEVAEGINYDKLDFEAIEEDLVKFEQVLKYKPMFDMISNAKSDDDINMSNSQFSIDEFVKFLPTYKKYVAELTEKYNSLEEAQAYLARIEKAFNIRETINNELKDLNERKVVLNEKKEIFNKREGLFNEFLTTNGFQTTHAKDIYDFIYNEKELNLNDKSFKIRKAHPTRDKIIKKGVIPTAVVSAGVGGVIGSIASQSLIAGTSAFGVVPVYGSIALTTFATASLGALAGLIATPAIILTKNKLTKLHYDIWYKNASKNLKDYESGVNIENLPITVLMEKVQKTKHKILNMNEGSIFSKIFKFIPKHILNAVNRNRLHHIEKFTKDLVQIDAYFPSEKTKNLLGLVENFVTNDIEESKLNAMLNCKKKGKHIHKTIENIDIFANLKIYLDTVDPTKTKKIIKQEAKQAKRIMKNMRQKEYVVNTLLGGERLIPRLIREKTEDHIVDTTKDYDKIYNIDPATNIEPELDVEPETEFKQPIKEEIVVQPVVVEEKIEEPKKVNEAPKTINPRKVVSQVIINGKMHVETANGKKHIFDAEDVKPLAIDTVEVNQGAKVVTYEDGSKSTIFTETMEISLRTIHKHLEENDVFLLAAISADENYNPNVLSNLKTKLSNWCANPTNELTFTTSEKKLLNIAFKECKESIKNNNSYII